MFVRINVSWIVSVGRNEMQRAWRDDPHRVLKRRHSLPAIGTDVRSILGSDAHGIVEARPMAIGAQTVRIVNGLGFCGQHSGTGSQASQQRAIFQKTPAITLVGTHGQHLQWKSCTSDMRAIKHRIYLMSICTKVRMAETVYNSSLTGKLIANGLFYQNVSGPWQMNRFNSISLKCSAALFTTIFILCLCPSVAGHDIITTKLTWDGEISRIVYAHCASRCHHQGEVQLSPLTSYQEARPWAKAIEQEASYTRTEDATVGAVKGFGESFATIRRSRKSNWS